MAASVVVTAHGESTSVLKLVPLAFSIDDPLPSDSALVEMRYAGLNFIDVYFRTGLYKKPQAPPFTTCDEGSGVVLRLPDGDAAHLGIKVGDRVAFFRGSSGAAATHAIVKLVDLFKVPSGMTDEQAAAVLLQGATAHYLTRTCYPVASGVVVLVQAAAGGTGLLISQICHLLGAKVIGTCGGPEKAQLATAVGKADAIIDYNASPEWGAAVKNAAAQLGSPAGVTVVFDGVGKSTFLGGLAVLKKRGHMITFGNASGPVDPISPLLLTQHGSVTLQRPTLKDYSASGGEIEGRVAELFDWVATGKIQLTSNAVFPLEDAAAAFDHLEGRKSTGKILLKCSQ